MKKKYQNGFFIFGVVVLIVMATQMNYQQVWNALSQTPYAFVGVIALWLVLYLFNTTTWYIIIKAGGKEPVSFAWLYKVTVSGFALNYATPGGLMGGEPYRIMALSPHIGTERASASVILFAMTHIFSHFWFWLLSIPLYLFTRPVTLPVGIILGLTAAACIPALWFFMAGYRKGLAQRLTQVFTHIPFLRNKARAFLESHREQLADTDRHIAALHTQNKRTFVAAVVSELLCRICSAAEVYIILLALHVPTNYFDAILIIAFTTLFANLLFFIPLQLGGREGGFLMATTTLGATAAQGIFVALLVRVRELVWTAIGLLLIKLERNKTKSKPHGGPNH